MSAIRRNDRRAARNNLSSPYARPRPVQKTSSWSLTGFLSYLNPLRSRKSEEPPESESDSNEEDTSAEISGELVLDEELGPPRPSRRRTEPTIQNDAPEARPAALQGSSTQPALGVVDLTLDDPDVSPTKNMQTVAQFLIQNSDRKLNRVERAGIMSLLDSNVEDDEDGPPQPFRFSSTPSTPARGNTPTGGFGLSTPNGVGPSSPSPRKLAKNPNGVYRWQGGGSARPRNRFHSPGFGSSAPAAKIKLAPPQTPPKAPGSEGKRRRIGDVGPSASISTSTPPAQQVPFPTFSPASPSPATPSGPTTSSSALSGVSFPISNGGPSQPNGLVNGASAAPKTPRARLQLNAPDKPSPLRQAWGGGSVSGGLPNGHGVDASPPHAAQASPNATRAANMMAELINEATPPKRPDVSNPYQTMSPVKPPAKKAVLPRKTRAAAAAAKRKEEEEKHELEAEQERERKKKKEMGEMSPQAIIEATVPKGMKRSRPPPEMFKQGGSTSPETSPRRDNRPQSPEPSSSNGRSANGVNGARSKPVYPTAVVEEASDEDYDMDSPSHKKTKRGTTNGVDRHASPSASAQGPTIEEIDEDEEMTSPTRDHPVTRPAEVIEWGAAPAPASTSTSPAASPTSPAGPRRVFPRLQSSAPKEPSKLRFSIQSEAEKDEAAAAAAAPASTPAVPAPTVAATASSPNPFAFGSFNAAPKPSTPPFSFPGPVSTSTASSSSSTQAKENTDPKAAALSADVTALPAFDFSVPSPAKASTGGLAPTAQTVKSEPADALPTFDFDFSDAKGKAPAINGFPSSTSASTVASAPVKAFDWSAAGLTPPPAAKAAEWECAMCMCKSPASADQCTVCETPR